MERIEVRRPGGQRRRRPEALAGDKAFSYRHVRQWLREHEIKAVIPLRSDQLASNPATAQAFDQDAYRDRNAIERCVGWLKECRRIMTRFEKLAMNFLTFVHVAMIERLLRIGLSDSAQVGRLRTIGHLQNNPATIVPVNGPVVIGVTCATAASLARLDSRGPSPMPAHRPQAFTYTHPAPGGLSWLGCPH
jgi:transposase